MKKTLFLMFFLAIAFSFNAMSQLGQVSVIGTINGWAGDHMMTRDLDNPNHYSTFLTIAAADTSDAGIIEVKFRENKGWDVNWGGYTYPNGVGVNNGPNFVVPEAGTYYITFDATITADSTHVVYSFTKTSGDIGLVGTINGWGGTGDDYMLTRSATAMNEYYGDFTINAADTGDNGKIEVKFRENQAWTVNWGSADGFPSGNGVQDGANLVVPPGNYHVTFNSTTGAYNFVTTAGLISMIGEFNAWSGDHWMDRSMTDPDKFSTFISFKKENDTNHDAVVEAKFRENAAWTINWGAADFPTGVGTNNGANILIPIDTTRLTTDFAVSFEFVQVSGTVSTANYSFTPVSGVISLIGAFNNWNGDFPLVRDATNPSIWHGTRSFYQDSEVKFRENHDWTANWGAVDFPTGTGTDNGANIPLVAGTYDITFNATTKAYSFVENTTAVGEIGLVGDFTNWGAAATDFDVDLVRDPMHPSYFTLTYNFAASTGVLFRMDSDPSFTDVWGGTFPSGTGVMDAAEIINVPAGLYDISFDANSGDFSFTQLGNSVTAAKVFAMTIDGTTNENDWDISNAVSKVVEGSSDSPAEVYFGLTYNAEYLYIGVNVTNATPADDVMEFFLDGNKSGGAYDDGDVHFKVATDGTVTVVKDATGVAPVGKVNKGTDSYSIEASVKWSELGVTADEGTKKGFDIIFDDGTAYKLTWNGGLDNYDNLSLLGDVLLGPLSCGCISLYNSNIGDVVLANPADKPTTYVGTYNLESSVLGSGVEFRKDKMNTVTWGANAFPTGTATVAGPMIPATADRWRIKFDCLSGEYSFVKSAVPAGGIVSAKYLENGATMDGDLSEYSLDYNSDLVVAGTGPNNNTVTWGAVWDENNLYIGAKVVDGTVDLAATGNPWDNDAIELYIDGNNTKDGAYSAGSFDTQLIMDVVSNNANGADGTDLMWQKADGVAITNFSSKWLNTSTGYTVEFRLGWDNFAFAPGRDRTIGFSLGNDDNDNGTGRDYQTVWYGTDADWSDNSVLGDLQLADGPYFFVGIAENHILNNANMELYPNPSNGDLHIKTVGDEFTGNVNVVIVDITGKVVFNTSKTIFGSNNIIDVNTSSMSKGIYLVNVRDENGKTAVKKLIIQ